MAFATALKGLSKAERDKKPPTVEGKSRSESCMGPSGSCSTCQRRISISSSGRLSLWWRLVLVVFMTSSPTVCERLISSTPSSHSTSGLPPRRRSGRSVDGRDPVAMPMAVMAKYCGKRARIFARKRGTSSGSSAFGSSSE
ncbi:MAG: hypothetical protein IPI67_12765 [Myxococcales bacterium]|nr:hypothetical protein [Myxococcales bacterium]